MKETLALIIFLGVLISLIGFFSKIRSYTSTIAITNHLKTGQITQEQFDKSLEWNKKWGKFLNTLIIVGVALAIISFLIIVLVK
jgi:hypothetical protein